LKQLNFQARPSLCSGTSSGNSTLHCSSPLKVNKSLCALADWRLLGCEHTIDDREELPLQTLDVSEHALLCSRAGYLSCRRL
jgi:hypothetical protein